MSDEQQHEPEKVDADEVYRRIVAGTLGLEFDPEEHVYRWDGAIVPSVTRIARATVGGSGGGEYGGTPEAAERGKRVEAAVQAFYERGLSAAYEGLEPEDEPFFDAFLDWLGTDEAADVIPRHWQVQIAVTQLWVAPYAGRLDILADTPRGVAVIDLKTKESAGAMPRDYWLQLAGYGTAVMKLACVPIRRGLLRLTPGETGRIEWDDEEQGLAGLNAWGSACICFDYLNRRKR